MNQLLALTESFESAPSGILVMVATSNDRIQHVQMTDTLSVSTWSLCPLNADIAAVELVTSRWSIGSGTENRVTLSDESVSPLHCLLIANERQLILRAWNEPTLVNGESVREAILKSGDELTMGRLQFRIEHSPAVESDEPDLHGVQDFSDPAQTRTDYNPASHTAEDRGAEILSRVDTIGETLNLLDGELHSRSSQNNELDSLIDRLEQDLSQKRELSSSTRQVIDELRLQVANLESNSNRPVAAQSNPTTHDDPRLRSEQQRLDTVLESAGVHSEVPEANPDFDNERFERIERELQIHVEAKLSQLDNMTRLTHARADVIEKLSREVEQAKVELKLDRIVYENDLAVLQDERQALQAERTASDNQLAFPLRDTDISEIESRDGASADAAESNVESNVAADTDETNLLDEIGGFNCGREDRAAGDVDLLSQRAGLSFSENVQDEIARKLTRSKQQLDCNQAAAETGFDLGPEFQTASASEWAVANDDHGSQAAVSRELGLGEFDLAKSADFVSEFDLVNNAAATDESNAESLTPSNDETDLETAIDQRETVTDAEVTSQPVTQSATVANEWGVENEEVVDSEPPRTDEADADYSAVAQPAADEQPAAIEQHAVNNDSTLDFNAMMAGVNDTKESAEPQQQEVDSVVESADQTDHAVTTQADAQLAQQRQLLREYMEEFGTQDDEENSAAEGDCDAQVPVGVAQANEFADGEITNGLRSRDEAVRQLDDLVRQATSRAAQGDPTLDSVDENAGSESLAVASTDTVQFDVASDRANETTDANEVADDEPHESVSSGFDQLDTRYDSTSTDEDVQQEETQPEDVQQGQASDEWATKLTSTNSEFDADTSTSNELTIENSAGPAETQVADTQIADDQVAATETENSEEASETWDSDPLANAFATAVGSVESPDTAQENAAETDAPGLNVSIDDLFENKSASEPEADQSQSPQSALASSLINEFEAADAAEETTAPAQDGDAFDTEGSQELRSRLALMFEIPDLGGSKTESSNEAASGWDSNLAAASEASSDQQAETSETTSQPTELPTYESAATPVSAATTDDTKANPAEETAVKSDGSQWDAADADSLGNYMQQLLARNRRQSGIEEKPAEKAQPEPVSRPAFPSAMPETLEDAGDEEQQDETDKRWLEDGPRHKQDRVAVRADMQALREVANTSARSAVKTASRKQLKVQIATKTAASLMALGFGSTGLILNVSTVISSCVVGLGFVFAAELAWTIKRQLVAEKREETPEDE